MHYIVFIANKTYNLRGNVVYVCVFKCNIQWEVSTNKSFTPTNEKKKLENVLICTHNALK